MTDVGYTDNPLQQILGMASLYGRLNQLRQRYPQATNGVKYQFAPDAAIKATNGPNYNALAYGDPRTHTAVFNTNFLNGMDGPSLDAVLAKETGQATQDRYIKNNSEGDTLMREWGIKNPAAIKDRLAGLGAQGWNGDTSHGLGGLPGAVQVHGYHSFPADTFGIEFGNALGLSNPDPAVATRGGIQNESIMQRLMQAGILPQGDAKAQLARQRSQNPAVLASENRMGQLLDRIGAFAQRPQMNLGAAAQATPAQPARVAAVQNLMSKFGF